jgi:hypothetical protein
MEGKPAPYPLQTSDFPHMTKSILKSTVDYYKELNVSVTSERHICSQTRAEYATGFLSKLFYQFC